MYNVCIANNIYHTCSYSQGTGRIWLDNVNCYSYNTRLSDCSHLGWGVLCSCSHSEDVALQCSSSTIGSLTGPAGASELEQDTIGCMTQLMFEMHYQAVAGYELHVHVIGL